MSSPKKFQIPPHLPELFSGDQVRAFIEQRGPRLARIAGDRFVPTMTSRQLNMLRLVSGLDAAPVDGCWLWRRSADRYGYGHIQDAERRSVSAKAHRISYVLAFGEIPEGLEIMHMCDVPSCINPDHLRPGTHAQNMADAKAKGRARGNQITTFKGGANNAAKLSEADVAEIRANLAQKIPQCVIAARFGVTPSNISHISRGAIWQG